MRTGWNFTIETTNGKVSLWTAWHGKEFKLFYPLSVDISDEMIMERLNVTLAEPKEENEVSESRLRTEYCSEEVEGNCKVMVHKKLSYCNENLRTIGNEQCQEWRMGHSLVNVIKTCTYCEKLQYKKKFLELLVKVAKLVGNVVAVNFDSDDSDTLYTPECLREKGYVLKEWRDENAHRIDEPKEYYYTRDENIEIMIVHFLDLDMEPGETIIRYPATDDLRAENLMKLLEDFDSSKKSINEPIPVLVL